VIGPRNYTPDRKETTAEGRTVTVMTLKRACNGCGTLLGDIIDRDVDDNGNLTDVRAECPNCRPLVEAEAAGCRTWHLLPRDFNRIDDEIDRLRPWVFTKGYARAVGPEQKLTLVGLRIGERPNHVVAFFGDWIIRHPDGHFAVHAAPGGEL
jgi:hypothetical protein